MALFQSPGSPHCDFPAGACINSTQHLFPPLLLWWLWRDLSHSLNLPQFFPALGTTQSWQSPKPLSKWVHEVFRNVRYAVSRTQRCLPRIKCLPPWQAEWDVIIFPLLWKVYHSMCRTTMPHKPDCFDSLLNLHRFVPTPWSSCVLPDFKVPSCSFCPIKKLPLVFLDQCDVLLFRPF
jgi:hypothetical protein